MLVLAAGGSVIALPGSDTWPAWATLPRATLGANEADLRLQALSWAMLAPNAHNLQSWIADIREPGWIHLSVDRQRLQPAADPLDRQALIGCGAFLELLLMAATQQGQHAQVTLLPQGDFSAGAVDGRPFATVRLTADASIHPDPLFAAAALRRTNRAPYGRRPPSAIVLTQLATAAQRPGIALHYSADARQVRRLCTLAIAAYGVEFGEAATWAASADRMRVGAAAPAVGPADLAWGPTPAWFRQLTGSQEAAEMRESDGVATKSALASSISATRHTPAWAWLSSADNSRSSQIEAGRAYLRVALTAARAGLAIHPNSQVLLEFEAMSALCRRLHAELGVESPARVQMLVRLGHAGAPSLRHGTRWAGS